jgi:hypothetical protein
MPGVHKKIQRTGNKRGAILEKVVAPAADLGRYEEEMGRR